jgi:hypothetical protein
MMTTFALLTVVTRQLVLATTHLLTVMMITCVQSTVAVNPVACVRMLTLIVKMMMNARQTAAILLLDVFMQKWFVSSTIASPPTVILRVDAPKHPSIVKMMTSVRTTLVAPAVVFVCPHLLSAMITTCALMILVQVESVTLPLLCVMTTMLALLMRVMKLLVCALLHQCLVLMIICVQMTIVIMECVYMTRLIVMIMTRALSTAVQLALDVFIHRKLATTVMNVLSTLALQLRGVWARTSFAMITIPVQTIVAIPLLDVFTQPRTAMMTMHAQ